MKNLLYLVFIFLILGCTNNFSVIDADSFIGISGQHLYEKLGNPIKGCIFITKVSNNAELNTTFVGYQSGTRLLVFHIQKNLVMDYHYSHYYSESLFNKNIGKCTIKEVYKKLGFPFAYGYTVFFDDNQVFRLFYKIKPEKKMFFFARKFNSRYLIVTFKQNKKDKTLLSHKIITLHDFGSDKTL